MNREESDQGVQALLDAAAKLPQDIAPKRDLWPEIVAQLEPQSLQTDSAPSDWRRPMRWAASFTGAALAVLAAFAVMKSRDVEQPAQVATTPGEAVTQPAEFLPITQDPSYRAARAELLTSFEKQLAMLPPEDRAKVEQGLKDIQSGLHALNQALQRNPHNAALRRLVLGAYQRELEYMQTIDTLTESMPQDLSI